MRLRSLTVVSAIALLAGASGASAQTQTVVPTLPPIVSSGQATANGPVPPGTSLHLTISLPLRNEATLQALIQAIYDPSSVSYHQYLSVEAFTQMFCVSGQDYASVVQWAALKGFSVFETTPNRRLIEVNATVGAINSAFGITLTNYTDKISGRQFYAPDREPVVDSPVQLHALVGLDDATPKFTYLRKGTESVDASGTTEEMAAIAHITGSGPGNTYLPSDMRAAYYGSGPLTGSGQTVGIFSFDGYKTNDIQVYYSNTGMSSSVPVNNVLVAGYSGACTGINGSGTCDDGEQILDIVNAIGMAPGLTQVLFYEGTSATSVLNKMATDNTAKVLSSSWGGGDFGSASDPAFLQFQAQGQTYVNATGDSGAFNSSTYAPPSVDPNITQIGGTDLTTSGAGGPWQAETGWADSGGGYVSGTSIPSYQQTPGVINSSNKGSTSLRNAPDLAAEANFDNSTVVNGSFQTGYGGTSFATPRWAGFFALANQQSTADGHGTVGWVNPAIYSLGLSANYNSDFHDITSGNNKPTSGGGSGFNAVAGYDLVTGWGSPNGANLINALAGSSGGTASFSLSTSTGSITITAGSSGGLTITATPSNGFSSSVSLSASGLPSGVTAKFNPSSIAGGSGSSTLTLTAGSGASAGTSTVTVTGTGGGLTETTSFSLTVSKGSTPSFSLSASPASVSVTQSGSASSTVSSTPSGGFSSTVSLSASGLPSGVTANFNPSSISGGSGTSTVTFTASGSASTGTSTVTITGSGGGVTSSTTISLTVNSSGGGGGQLITDGGFESATKSGLTAPGWTATTNLYNHNIIIYNGSYPYAGRSYAALGGVNYANDKLTQTITIPAGSTSTPLTFELSIYTTDCCAAYDYFYVEVHNTSGTLLSTLLYGTNLNSNLDYNTEGLYFEPQTVDLSQWAGQTIELVFHATNDSLYPTIFLVDNVSVTAN